MKASWSNRIGASMGKAGRGLDIGTQLVIPRVYTSLDSQSTNVTVDMSESAVIGDLTKSLETVVSINQGTKGDYDHRERGRLRLEVALENPSCWLLNLYM